MSDKTQQMSADLFKDSCDHCGTIVPKKYWTFDLQQCVVCDDPYCKEKQKQIFRAAMDDIVDGVLEGRIKL